MARRNINNEDEEIRKVPVLKTTYEHLAREASAKGITIEEVIEEKLGREFGDREMFVTSLIESLDGHFWDRRLRRKEWMMELYFYGSILYKMGQAHVGPILQGLSSVAEQFKTGFTTALAVLPKGEDREKAAKAKVAEKMADVMTNFMDVMLRTMGMTLPGGVQQIPQRSLKEFLEEEKPLPPVEQRPIDKFEEEEIKSEEEVGHGESEKGEISQG